MSFEGDRLSEKLKQDRKEAAELFKAAPDTMRAFRGLMHIFMNAV